jgi:hypothetical protein
MLSWLEQVQISQNRGFLSPVILSYTHHRCCPIHVTTITGHHSGSEKGIQSLDTCTVGHLNYLIYILDSTELIPIIQDIMIMWSNNELSFSGKFIYQLGQCRSVYRIQHLIRQNHINNVANKNNLCIISMLCFSSYMLMVQLFTIIIIKLSLHLCSVHVCNCADVTEHSIEVWWQIKSQRKSIALC